jgi:hypothetical protein
MKARLVIIATASAVVGLNACGDITSLKANFTTSIDTMSVFALSGTPPSYPSGLAVLARQPVRVDGAALFDVALDITEDGKAIVYPVKLVVPNPNGARPVGLQLLPTTFDEVTIAPKDGYQTDTAVVLHPNETLVVQSSHNSLGDVCQFAINPNVFAKIAVDSVNAATRTLYVRLGLDPNCGFRSFEEGIPTS